MKFYKFVIKPKGAFGTPLTGDTLFGHMCWAFAEKYGEEKLEEMLEDYDQNPFLIVSDAFFSGYVKKPTISDLYLQDEKTFEDIKNNLKKRKELKRKQLFPVEKLSLPLSNYSRNLVSLKDIEESKKSKSKLCSDMVIIHNSIDPISKTTSEGKYAPYSSLVTFYNQDNEVQLDIYILFDDKKNKNLLNINVIELLLQNIGKIGFGRDKSIGNGCFTVIKHEEVKIKSHKKANAYMTLGPSAITDVQNYNKENCFYKTFVKYGRLGGTFSIGEGCKPFKAPILMMESGAILTPIEFDNNKQYVGSSLRSITALSEKIVHQAYAPIVKVFIDQE